MLEDKKRHIGSPPPDAADQSHLLDDLPPESDEEPRCP
jgi:hypothetical protein